MNDQTSSCSEKLGRNFSLKSGNFSLHVLDPWFRNNKKISKFCSSTKDIVTV